MSFPKRLLQAALVTLFLAPFALDARAEAVRPAYDGVTEAETVAELDPLLEPFLFAHLDAAELPADTLAGDGKKKKKGDGKKRRRKKDGDDPDADDADDDDKRKKRRKKRRRKKKRKKKGDDDQS